MSPFRGKKRKDKAAAEEEKKTAEVESEARAVEDVKPEKLTPASWFNKLANLGDVQSALHSLPDLDIQLYVGNSLLRFIKKGLDKPIVSEERSLRPDAIIRISDKAWEELVKMQSLDEFDTLYRKYAKNPSHDEFVKVSINKESLLSDSGILRSKLFKNLLLV
ncbi:MAG: hypothetical protein WED04_01040 [Promethearchaeati archaeon SRVP18_Atabeyarchaeia-1]